jgi:hypothetical protein
MSVNSSPTGALVGPGRLDHALREFSEAGFWCSLPPADLPALRLAVQLRVKCQAQRRSSCFVASAVGTVLAVYALAVLRMYLQPLSKDPVLTRALPKLLLGERARNYSIRVKRNRDLLVGDFVQMKRLERAENTLR